MAAGTHNTANLVQSGDLMLFVGTSKTPIAFSTSAKLSISMATKDVTSKDSGIFTEKIGARLDWNVSTDGLLNYALTTDDTMVNAIDELYTLMIARQPITVAFGVKATGGTSPDWVAPATPAKCFNGVGLITSIDQNADLDLGTYSIKIDGTGSLTWGVLA